MTTPRKPAKRAAALRKAFVRRFGPINPTFVNGFEAFKAGAYWQRRRKPVSR